MKFLQQTLNTKYGGNIFVTPGLNRLRPEAEELETRVCYSVRTFLKKSRGGSGQMAQLAISTGKGS